MAIDLLQEELRTVSYARKRWIPRSENGKPVNPSTLWRWINKGLLGSDGTRIRLEVVCRGRTLYTTREAVARFFEELTAARLQQREYRQEARSESTTRRLQEAGLV